MGLVGATTLPDGTVVRGRGRREALPPGPRPEFGLCLGRPGRDPGPSWPHTWIEWRDFGTPRHPGLAVSAIVGAFERARRGERVEVTCGGGTGRTGTAIACMAVLAGVPADQAVAWTRTHYRPAAVETGRQRRWVRRFARAVTL